jgi:hypothetical protein
MNVNSLSNNASSYIQSVISQALSSATGTPASGTSSTSNIDASSLTMPQESNPQLSPFAQVLSTLQQLQQSNPTEYSQVTSQIATNLQSAAKTATSQGNTAQANELNQLATDFQNASQNNTLPNIQDLAQAAGGGHGHHHHHMHADSSDSSNSSSTTTSNGTTGTTTSTSGSSSSDPLSQLISMFFTNSSTATQNNSLDPMSIITSTLNAANLG